MYRLSTCRACLQASTPTSLRFLAPVASSQASSIRNYSPRSAPSDEHETDENSGGIAESSERRRATRREQRELRAIRKGTVPSEDEAYKADELEARLKALTRARRNEKKAAAAAAAVSERKDDMEESDDVEDGIDAPRIATNLPDGRTRDDAEAVAEEEWMNDEDLDLVGKVEEYSFDLEEPEFDPGHFGLKQRRPEYPTVIKLRPELDPELDADELEEIRRLGDIRRQTERKRRSRGDFLDYLRIRARGGRGGAGAASFGLAKSGGLGAPAGGNGGQGGSVYIQTSNKITSLHTLNRRYMAGQGKSGGRELRNGQQGEDLLITVPVGTVVREVMREGDEERQWERMEMEGMDMEERKWDRWERWFQISASNPFDAEHYTAAERHLRREKKWATRTPTFSERAGIVLDLDKPTEEPILLARGGNGGMGNPFFAGLVGWRQPRFSSRGITPYTSTFELELKILADVGLVGFPNAGKSTILRCLTGRRAEVAGYQFTTLNPQVGVLRVWDDGTWGGGGEDGETAVVDETWREKERDRLAREGGTYRPLERATRVRERRDIEIEEVAQAEAAAAANEPGAPEKVEAYRYTISDNPGLLPQAAENVGLGHSFLRSIERSLALAYVLDIGRPDPAEDLLGLRGELEAYKEGLASKAAVVILNKADGVGREEGQEKAEKVRAMVNDLPEAYGGRLQVVVLSGKFGLGMDKLVHTLGERVQDERWKEIQSQEEKRDAEGGLAFTSG